MSRSGYVDDVDDAWANIMWRGAVASALRGKRGQDFLKEMLSDLDAMPVKRLIANELVEPDTVSCSHWGSFEYDSVCAIGAVGKARGVDMGTIDPEDYQKVASQFGIARAMAQEILWVNDEAGRWLETPEQRFVRVREWVQGHIVEETSV
jgi:hypothetical protein